MADVLVIGAGAIGMSIALGLARRGASVRVLERSAPGSGASSTAAGVLGVQNEVWSDSPIGRLCAASLDRYPAWVAELASLTGIDVGFRACGGMAVSFDAGEADVLAARGRWAEPLGFGVERLDGAGVRLLEPALSVDVAGAARFPREARLDPPSLVRALSIAAARAGVAITSGALVRKVVVEGERAAGVLLEDGTRLSGGRVVLSAGSWSALVEGVPLASGAVRPSRGQIVELVTEQPVIRGVIYGPGCYLSPRDDGRVLVGSTLEFVGFRPGVTAGAVQALLAAAIRLVPVLSGANVNRTWSCFRPATPDELPLLGATSVEGLYVASGHFRNGIVLTPITAEILGSVIEGKEPPVDIAPFHPMREMRGNS